MLEYLRRQNRPYAHTQIFENLHGAVKKAAVPVILDKLTSDGQLKVFEFGKTKLYVANQDAVPLDDAEVGKMDTDIKQLNEEASKLRPEVTALESGTLRRC